MAKRKENTETATGEASESQQATGRPAADVPKGVGGVAAAPAPPSRRLVLVRASGAGFQLQFYLGDRFFRENITIARCDERMRAMAHSAEQVALWEWKKQQILDFQEGDSRAE